MSEAKKLDIKTLIYIGAGLAGIASFLANRKNNAAVTVVSPGTVSSEPVGVDNGTIQGIVNDALSRYTKDEKAYTEIAEQLAGLQGDLKAERAKTSVTTITADLDLGLDDSNQLSTSTKETYKSGKSGSGGVKVLGFSLSGGGSGTSERTLSKDTERDIASEKRLENRMQITTSDSNLARLFLERTDPNSILREFESKGGSERAKTA